MAGLAVIITTTLVACVSTPAAAPLGEPVVIGDQWSDSTTGTPASPDSCELERHDNGLLPDPACTPGAITTQISPAETSPVCTEVPETEPADSVRDSVLAAYGVDAADEGDYTVVYLIPRRLGGANDMANLWPVPTSDPSAKDKSDVDRIVADAVCGGRAGIQAAHYALSRDWTTAKSKLGLGG
ncbi:hypothetical protein [Schumannella luteola]